MGAPQLHLCRCTGRGWRKWSLFVEKKGSEGWGKVMPGDQQAPPTVANMNTLVCVLSCSVMSDSLWPHGGVNDWWVKAHLWWPWKTPAFTPSEGLSEMQSIGSALGPKQLQCSLCSESYWKSQGAWTVPSVGTKTGHSVQASVVPCQIHWGGNHQSHFDAFKSLTGIDIGNKPVHGGTEMC